MRSHRWSLSVTGKSILLQLKISLDFSHSEESKESLGAELTLWETYQWRNSWKEIKEKEAMEKEGAVEHK